MSALGALDHRRNEEMTAVDDADQVDADDPIPIVEWCIEQTAGHPHAGVVHEDVNRPNRLVYLGGERFHFGPVGNIDLAAQHAPPELARLASGHGEAGLVYIAQEEIGAAARKRQRGGAADSAPRAGHHRAAAFQIAGVDHWTASAR